MKKYNKECGLSRYEWELEKLVNAVRKADSSIQAICILSEGFEKLKRERDIEPGPLTDEDKKRLKKLTHNERLKRGI